MCFSFDRFEEIASVNFARGGGSTRSFDFEVETKNGVVHTFSSIEKEEYNRLYDFVNNKKLRVKNTGRSVRYMIFIYVFAIINFIVCHRINQLMVMTLAIRTKRKRLTHIWPVSRLKANSVMPLVWFYLPIANICFLGAYFLAFTYCR